MTRVFYKSILIYPFGVEVTKLEQRSKLFLLAPAVVLATHGRVPVVEV